MVKPNFINVRLLAYHISVNIPLIHGYGIYKVRNGSLYMPLLLPCKVKVQVLTLVDQNCTGVWLRRPVNVRKHSLRFVVFLEQCPRSVIHSSAL